MDIATIESFIKTTAADMAIKILAAIAFWIIGRWLIGRVIKLVQPARASQSARRGAACSATSRPARSCWCCARSRWATS